MKIELKVLNEKFYNEKFSGRLLNPLPDYQTTGSAAVDLVCTEDVVLYPGETKMIPTGLAIHIGSGVHDTSFFSYVGLILPRSRSGTEGLILANTVGVIDEDYQGELMVSVWNRNKVDYSRTADGTHIINHHMLGIKAGDRFAQLLFTPIIKVSFEVVDEFSQTTDRGQGGFGHSGV